MERPDARWPESADPWPATNAEDADDRGDSRRPGRSANRYAHKPSKSRRGCPGKRTSPCAKGVARPASRQRLSTHDQSRKAFAHVRQQFDIIPGRFWRRGNLGWRPEPVVHHCQIAVPVVRETSFLLAVMSHFYRSSIVSPARSFNDLVGSRTVDSRTSNGCPTAGAPGLESLALSNPSAGRCQPPRKICPPL